MQHYKRTVRDADEDLTQSVSMHRWHVGQRVRIWCAGTLHGEPVYTPNPECAGCRRWPCDDGCDRSPYVTATHPHLLADEAVVTRVTTSGIYVKSLPPDGMLPVDYIERLNAGDTDPLHDLCLAHIHELRFGPTGHRIRTSHDGDPMDVSTWIEAIKQENTNAGELFP